MGHKTTGTQETYWRPTEQDVLEDYLKAVPLLTINKTEAADSQSAAVAETINKKISELEARLAGFESLFDRLNKGKKQIEENFWRLEELDNNG